MANKKITDLTAYTTPLSVDVLPIVDVANSATKKVTMANLMNVLSSFMRVKDSSDTTKQVAFDVSGVTTATTRTLTIPDANTTIVGTDTTQTLTNKTIGTGTKINTSGSDGTGAMYYRDSAGLLQPVTGTTNQIISLNGSNIPQFIPNPSASDASTTVKGVSEIATDAEVNAGTATGSTGAILVIAASSAGAVAANKIVQFTSATKYPAADGSLITNIPYPFKGLFASNTTTKNTSDASTTQNIAHGLGVIPKYTKITAMILQVTGFGKGTLISTSVYNGTTQSSMSAYGTFTNAGDGTVSAVFRLGNSTSDYQEGVITFDSTNISITWTKTGSPSGTYTMLWEAQA